MSLNVVINRSNSAHCLLISKSKKRFLSFFFYKSYMAETFYIFYHQPFPGFANRIIFTT